MTIERPERRARAAALGGLLFQIAISVSFGLLAVWSGAESMRALTYLAVIGAPLWFVLLLVTHQRVQVQDEAFETEQLKRERASGAGSEAIFGVEDEELLLARRRLRWMYRWLLPAFTVVLVAELVACALVGWPWALGDSLSAEAWPAVEHAGTLIGFVVGGALLSFLFSRYVTGMARYPEWRMLRAGAAYLMGVTLAAAATAAALGALQFEAVRPERAVAYVLRLLLLVLAGEFTLNLVLDFYRPRAPDEEPRPAFDSRLLGLFTEPGGIARSIAEAINYQFGFEVSSTWFYQLLQRSVVPLIGFAILTLFAASCFVFVSPDEELVVERFGRRVELANAGPGLHFKWPWPIDVASKVATAQVHTLQLGSFPEVSAQQAEKERLILWTNKHSTEPHLKVLVATPTLNKFLQQQGQGEGEPSLEVESPATRPASEGAAVPVSLFRVAVTIQYQIEDAYEWLRTYHDNPKAMFEAVANRAVMRYCAGVDKDSLLGAEQGPIEQALWESIQKAADERKLGVKIVFLGLQGVHPPEKTAEAFQDVIGAESKKTASIRSARAESNTVLSEMAGDMGRARELADAIERMNRLNADESADEAKRTEARERADTLLFGDARRGIAPMGGKAAEMIMAAREERWQQENQARGEAVRFTEEIATKNAAPRVYYMRKYLEALATASQKIRKYVIACEGQVATPTYHLNLYDAMGDPFDTLLGKKKP